MISSCWLTVELGSTFYEDPEASRSEKGTLLSDEPDCVVGEVTLESNGTESDFTETIESPDDDGSTDVE